MKVVLVVFLLALVVVAMASPVVPLPFFGHNPLQGQPKAPVSSYTSISSLDTGDKPLFFIEPDTSVQSVASSSSLIQPSAYDSTPIYRPASSYQPSLSYEVPPKYSFDWAIKDDFSNSDFGHEETRDGDHTRGSYSVLLPDGRLQTVRYYVDDDSGYVAEVSYKPAYKPLYNPVPVYTPKYIHG
ncbi:uncharacterized protein [Panulirus ornatus]|uniref:uncharacterized protein n=1 Tax=Panulirus ornatus TaxID=150431 RepID=UPI003A89B03B